MPVYWRTKSAVRRPTLRRRAKSRRSHPVWVPPSHMPQQYDAIQSRHHSRTYQRQSHSRIHRLRAHHRDAVNQQFVNRMIAFDLPAQDTDGQWQISPFYQTGEQLWVHDWWSNCPWHLVPGRVRLAVWEWSQRGYEVREDPLRMVFATESEMVMFLLTC